MIGDWMGSQYDVGGRRYDYRLFLDHDFALLSFPAPSGHSGTGCDSGDDSLLARAPGLHFRNSLDFLLALLDHLRLCWR